jgi:hypothetical protein
LFYRREKPLIKKLSISLDEYKIGGLYFL